MSIASRMAAQKAAGGRSQKQTTRGGTDYKTSGSTSSDSFHSIKNPNTQVFDVEKQEIVPLGIPEKPTGAPRYYTERGIMPDPGHGWVFDSEQNIWTWKMTEREKDLVRLTNDEYEDKFMHADTINKETILWDGLPMTVQQDDYGSYIVDDEGEMLHYLKIGWWEHPEMRLDADKAISFSRSFATTKEGSEWKWPNLIPSVKFAPKKEVGIPNPIPNVTVGNRKEVDVGGMIGLPKLSSASASLLTVAGIFIGGIVLLVAVGYSGIFGSSSVRKR